MSAVERSAEAASAVERMLRQEADPAFRRRARLLFEWLGEPGERRILDCGCGRGFYLKMLHHRGARRLAGVDLEPALLARARRNTAGLDGITIASASVYALPFPDASFDVVFLSEVLEHVERDGDALAEIRRVLAPGGEGFLTVPHADYPFLWDPLNKTLETLFGTHIGRGPLAGLWANHVRLYRPADLRRRVEAAGFQVVEERSFVHRCLPFTHNVLYGIGKPLLESGLLGCNLADAVDRASFDRDTTRRWNPMRAAVRLLQRVDRKNHDDEPPGVTTVNLALRARKVSTRP